MHLARGGTPGQRFVTMGTTLAADVVIYSLIIREMTQFIFYNIKKFYVVWKNSLTVKVNLNNETKTRIKIADEISKNFILDGGNFELEKITEQLLSNIMDILKPI